MVKQVAYILCCHISDIIGLCCKRSWCFLCIAGIDRPAWICWVS